MILGDASAPPFRHFEVADGFALTLIAILFAVLAGVVMVARHFLKRERLPTPRGQVVRDLGDEPEAVETPQSASDNTKSWERDGNWWKNS